LSENARTICDFFGCQKRRRLIVRAEKIVRRLVASCLDEVHRARFSALLQAVDAVTRAQRVTLTSIGRAVRAACTPRHGIKKIDRLLGNVKLHRERLLIYGAVVKHFVSGQRRVVVLVDWTKAHDDLWVLAASIPFLGRSLPILACAHPESAVGNRAVQDEFLRALRQIIPRSCTPVIVADGGFRSPFFQSCAGMHFVIRLRNDRSVALVDDGQKRLSFGEIFDTATGVAQCLGDAIPYGSSPHACLCRLVLGPAPNKVSRRKKYRDDYERKRGCEPWLLATNLPNDDASSIVAIYESRMQIEETFRDAKSPRLGWALEYAKTRCARRFDILLLLMCIALVATILIGAAAEERHIDRDLRASSIRARVLSLFTLGGLVLRNNFSLGIHAVWKQLKRFRQLSRDRFPEILRPKSGNRFVNLPLPHGLFCTNCGWKGREYGWPD
jgi:hypothetical protein